MRKKKGVVNFVELSTLRLTGFYNRETIKKILLISMAISLLAFSTFAQSVSVRLIVSNLPATATESEVRSFFKNEGIEISNVQFIKTIASGKPLLTGLVNVDVSNAEKSLNLGKAKQFMGNTLSISISAADKAKFEAHKNQTQPKPTQPTAVASPTPVVTAQPAPKIAVLEFANKADNQWWFHGGAEAAQDVFVTELVGTKKFQVIDREKLEELLREKNLTLSGEVTETTAVKVGKLLGVNYLLTGSVIKYGNTDVGGTSGGVTSGVTAGKRKFVATIKVQLVNSSTGKSVWSDEVSAEETSVKVSVGGFGGGVDDERMFDAVMKPLIKKAIANLKATDLKL